MFSVIAASVGVLSVAMIVLVVALGRVAARGDRALGAIAAAKRASSHEEHEPAGGRPED